MGKCNWASSGSDREAQGCVQIERTRLVLKTLIQITFDEPELNLLHYTRTKPELDLFLHNGECTSYEKLVSSSLIKVMSINCKAKQSADARFNSDSNLH